MKKLPYVGITGFCYPEETAKMLRQLEDMPKPLHRRLMVGVMMSYSTLHGTSSRWTQIFPPKERVASIFCPHPFLYNCLHYADYKDREFEASLHLANRWSGVDLDSIQFDMIWPDPNVIKKFRERNPTIEMIIQIGTGAFERVNDSPQGVVKKLKEYNNTVEYILLDKSMGVGKPMDINFLRPFLYEIRDHCPQIGLAVAGGLGPQTLDLIVPLLEEFPDLSFDAEGKLRPSGSGKDPVDWNMAAEYVQKAFDMTRPKVEA